MSINSKTNQEEQINDAFTETCSKPKPSDPCATVTTQAQSITEQIAVTPVVIPAGPVVVKIPVVLVETNITIPVEATITLDQTVMEIKRIKKNVFLTQSRLIPFSQDNRENTGIIFIEGFVRKNIEYATQACPPAANAVNVCGDIRHCTVEVPFNFTTRVTFLRRPIFTQNTTPLETLFFTEKLESCDVCADPVLGRNTCDQSFFTTEFYNEKPYVELVKADITEIDIHLDPTSDCKTPTEQKFTKITEKIVINLTLKVLQNQQVRVTAIGN